MSITVRRESRSQQAYNQLRRKILIGEFRPGERIQEERLAEMLSISRTPVRDALRRLQRDGLVRLAGHGGATITPLNAAELEDLYEVRTALESLAARLAAERATGDHVTLMREALLAAQQAWIRGDKIGVLEANSTFHDTIYRAAGSRYLREVLETVRAPLLLFRATICYAPGEYDRVLAEHRVLVEQIEQHNPAGAEAAMRDHMQSDRERVRPALAQWTEGAAE